MRPQKEEDVSGISVSARKTFGETKRFKTAKDQFLLTEKRGEVLGLTGQGGVGVAVEAREQKAQCGQASLRLESGQEEGEEHPPCVVVKLGLKHPLSACRSMALATEKKWQVERG